MKAQFENAEIVIGVDLSVSNLQRGKRYWGASLHDDVHVGDLTIISPYARILQMLSCVINDFDSASQVVMAGFSEEIIQWQSENIDSLYSAYNQLRLRSSECRSSDKVSIAPLVDRAIKRCQRKESMQILIILTCGDIYDVHRDAQYVIAASRLPIAICCIGVGRGPFDCFKRFDSALLGR